MRSSMATNLRGWKALVVSLRRRVWAGGSEVTIHSAIISITGPALARFSGLIACSSGRTRSEERRLSPKAATTSS